MFFVSFIIGITTFALTYYFYFTYVWFSFEKNNIRKDIKLITGIVDDLMLNDDLFRKEK